MMKTRTLGKNGPKLTVIGFGAWAIGGSWEFGWGASDDKESIKAIHRGLDLGINWIDTAAVYGLGHSEEIVSQALRGIRNEVFIATKCGMVWNEQGVVTKSLKPASIRREVEASLRRLQTDHIDLYQFHWPDPDTPVEDSWKTMADLKREGKVRNIGVSNFSVAELERCQSIAPVQSLQPPYNMLKRDVEKDLLAFCGRNGIGVVAYSPMASGLLTGKFDFDKLASDDWRKKSSQFSDEGRKKVMKLLEQLKPVAGQYKISPGELAVAWVLKNENVTSAIVGARKPWQIEEIVRASDINMSTDDYQSINRLLLNL
jgi:aryl-alcohol dehydrogenase-like predicted oxidoreductase